MKKANKEAAREWQQEQSAAERAKVELETQKELLRYAAHKRKAGFPCPETIRQLGYPGVAESIEQAYRLLEYAYNRLDDQTRKLIEP